MEASSKIRKFIKVAGAVASVPVALLLMLCILLYLPPVQEVITRKISEAVALNSDFKLKLGSVQLSFPLKLVIKDFELSAEEGTIASGKEIAASVRLLPLLRGEAEVNYLSLEESKVDTRNLIPGTRIKGEIGNFRTVARSVNLVASEANIKQIYLNNANISIDIEKSDTAKESSSSTAAWLVELQKGDIENLHLAVNIPGDTMQITADIGELTIKKVLGDIAANRYNIATLQVEKSAATYDQGGQTREEAPLSHIAIKDFTLFGNEISYNPGSYAANIERLSFAQEGGATITDGRITAKGDTAHIDISGLEIKSLNGTYISGDIKIPFNTTSKEKTAVALAAHINKRDVTGFLTTAQKSGFAHLPDSLLNAKMELNGTLDNLGINSVTISLPTIAAINIKGKAKEIADNKKRNAEIAIDGIIENTGVLTGDAATPTSPLAIKGDVKIQQELYYTAIDIAGKGDAHITAFYDLENNAYDIKADARTLDLQASLPSLPVTNLTLRTAISGQGTDIFDKRTYYQLVGNIDTVRYNGTTFNDITISAYQANALSLLSLISRSNAADLSILANSHIDSLQLSTLTDIDIKNIDLAAIGASETPLSAAIKLNIDAQSNLKETHSLKAEGKNIAINTNNKRYSPAPLKIDFATSPQRTHLNAQNGDFLLKSHIAGGYTLLARQLDKVKIMIDEARNREGITYYATDIERELPATDISVVCGNNNMLSNVLAINGIELGNATLSCKLDTIKGLYLNATADNISTPDAAADSIRIRISQNGENIKYFAGARKTANDEKDKKKQFNAALFGNICKDTLNTNITFTGNSEESRTAISGTTLMKPKQLDIHLQPKALFFGTPITINTDNYISIAKNNTISANLMATDKENAGLHLYTIEDSIAKHDITLEFSNINLYKLTSTLPFVPEIAGMLNGDVHYRNDAQGEIFSCDIIGDSISYEGTYLGNEILETVYLPKKNGLHYLGLTLHHNENEVLNLHGDYNQEGSITGSTTITHFPLHIANAFAKESGLSFGGYIEGELSIDGPLTTPSSEGFIKFDSVSIDAPLLGSRLRLDNSTMNIKESCMRFNAFKIYAKGSTPFNINGSIDFSRITDPVFDLRMMARNYELVNAPRQKGSIVYGNLNMNISSTIKGPLNSLNVRGSATVLGNSNVTYVLEENSIANNNELEGLVEFVNFQDTTPTPAKEETVHPGNITMSIALDIEESAWLNADLVPDRSSYISLQGGGKLNMNYSNEGGLTLTGRYTLNSGEMKYDIPVIPLKTFNISQGSYIYWTGDAFNPMIDITALERVVTPVSIDGMGSQPVAFDVGVVLNNSLDDMGLNFTMKAPENAVIQDELNSLDAETLNKYAVTMLITGAYVGSNGGLTVSNALTSFLDAKINDIAGNAMKNVSINVGIADVENNETGGSYMNYSFSFAKRFWNDRLTIIVGGEVNSGDTPENNQSFINNVSLEWKISNNGNRYLRLFYDKNYESLLEGEITETGVGYVYKRKLNNLSELLYFKKRDTKQPTPVTKRKNEK